MKYTVKPKWIHRIQTMKLVVMVLNAPILRHPLRQASNFAISQVEFIRIVLVYNYYNCQSFLWAH